MGTVTNFSANFFIRKRCYLRFPCLQPLVRSSFFRLHLNYQRVPLGEISDCPHFCIFVDKKTNTEEV